MAIEAPISQFISSYPRDLAEPLQNIHTSFPHLLPMVKNGIGGSIQIELVVDLPQSEGKVALAALRERSISVEGLKGDDQGLVTIDALAAQNIRVGRELYPAWCDFTNKTIVVAHSSYASRKDADWEGVITVNLIFEMHNACQAKSFRKLGRVKDREAYTRAFERLEHTSSHLTCARLEAMAEKEKFDSRLNEFRLIYKDPGLHFLHQQLMGHAFDIARIYDEQHPNPFRSAFRGTWATPFDSEDRIHGQARESLWTILNEQLYTIRYGHAYRDDLDAELERVEKGALQGKEWAILVQKNLIFFQRKYQEYVRRERPERVVNLIAIPAPQTCAAAASSKTPSFFSFPRFIRA